METASRARAIAERPWRTVSVPAESLGIPAMLSGEELQLLYALARDFAQEGAVVDAGCLFGGSTVPLLAGLRDRSWDGPPLVSYDRFRVEAWMIPPFFADDPGVRVGDSFRALFDRNVSGFEVPHRVVEGDVIEQGWAGGPIDVLFLDLVKSWKINDAIMRDFFPHVRPGSLIVQQDYGWGAGPWIHITMELLADSVKLVGGMKTSHVFLVERELDRDLLESGIRGLSHDEQLDVIDRAIERLSGWPRGMVELARLRIVAHRDGRAAALEQLEPIARAYTDTEVQLAVAYARDHLALGVDGDVRFFERQAADDTGAGV
jgi:predicted O-methyltransferase YrrM